MMPATTIAHFASVLAAYPVGTVLVQGYGAGKNYMMVCHDGLRNFQYDWYLAKFPTDPADWGIGVKATSVDPVRVRHVTQLDVAIPTEFLRKSKLPRFG